MLKTFWLYRKSQKSRKKFVEEDYQYKKPFDLIGKLREKTKKYY